MSNRGVFTVIPAETGIQGIQLITFWIALKLHFVPRLRGNNEGYKLKLPDPWIKYKCAGMKIYRHVFRFFQRRFPRTPSSLIPM